MRYYDLSTEQLEEKAVELLLEFDEERLYKTKPIDVYAVIEKCLDVPYDWKYLSPDQSILGATAFSSGLLWVWPKSEYSAGLLPYQIEVETGTIIIDATLTEQDNRGRENFTVMHEVFHQKLHKDYFLTIPEGVHMTKRKTIDGRVRYENYELTIIETQANACAAAFLMPASLIRSTYEHIYWASGIRRYNYGFVYNTVIKEMAEIFSVSKEAMKIRLQTLGLIERTWKIY